MKCCFSCETNTRHPFGDFSFYTSGPTAQEVAIQLQFHPGCASQPLGDLEKGRELKGNVGRERERKEDSTFKVTVTQGKSKKFNQPVFFVLSSWPSLLRSWCWLGPNVGRVTPQSHHLWSRVGTTYKMRKGDIIRESTSKMVPSLYFFT